MKRQSILFVLFLLLTLLTCYGCGNSENTVPQDTDTTVTEAASEETAFAEPVEEESAEEEVVENVIGIFEGLEDNHTAIFSFDGAEIVFYFEAPAVQDVLFGAITGSPYTLSYNFDSSLGLNVIYEISE